MIIAIVITAALGLLIGWLLRAYTARAPITDGPPAPAPRRSAAGVLPLATAALFALITWRFLSGDTTFGFGGVVSRLYYAPFIVIPLFYATALIVIAVTDTKYQRVKPIVINIALAAALLASTVWFYFWPGAPTWPGTGIGSALFGVAVGSVSILLPCMITRERGIGFGDVMIGALVGAITGFPLIIIAVVIGWASGIVAALIYRLKKKEAIPFGPFLAGGALITMLWGPQIYHYCIG